MIKKTVTTVKSNPIGAIVGAAVVFFAAKKLAKLDNKIALVAAIVVGGVAGSYAQSKFAAKKSVPTAETVKK